VYQEYTQRLAVRVANRGGKPRWYEKSVFAALAK
jgi:hypothetical protein